MLGTGVEYRDSNGRRKAAIVIATNSTIAADDHSGVTPPEEGHVHLQVFSFTGNHYTKHNVAAGDGPETFTPPKESEALF